jgi:hexosaminidase
VHVADPSVTVPTLDVDVSYTLTVPAAGGGDAATLTAATPFGALYGLDTFSQLVSAEGVVLGAAIAIADAPSFRHRGLTIDVGRRFAPVALVESILDGLAYSKMNVLHMSLSGPTVRVAMPDAFPELTAWMQDGQYYTQDQIRGLVEYARLRGVMVIPEIDIPAHASGFFPLAETLGLQFCDADRTTLNNDPTTVALVLRVFDEIVKLFPSPIIHIGGDEALPKGGCTFQSIHQVEIAVQQHLIKRHGRTPMGWNEVYSSPRETAPNGAIAGHTILQNWKGTGDADTVGAGFASVDSEYLKLYLNEQCCRVNPSSADGPTARFKQCFYVDPARGLTVAQRAQPDVLHLLQGAEAAMWSDEYCPSPLCAISGTYGWMSDPKYDDVYIESFGKQVFPKTSATGAGLWNFLNETVLPGAELARRLDAHNARLVSREVVTCPSGCNCDWGQSCGKPYAGRVTKPKLRAKLVNKTPFPVKVRSIKPCNRTSFGNLAVLQPGQSYVATGDFETEATAKGNDPEILTGDPFDLWVGDSTWMDIQAEFHITYDASKYGSGYMAYTQIGSSAAPTEGMHVGIESALERGTALYVKKYSKGVSSSSSSLALSQTLCHLKVNHASCLVRGTGDWIAETINMKTGMVVAQSDPFSAWYGGGYASANVTLVVTQDAKNSGYLDITAKHFGHGSDGSSKAEPPALRGAALASIS